MDLEESGAIEVNHINSLQEWALNKLRVPAPVYTIRQVAGPLHNQVHRVTATIGLPATESGANQNLEARAEGTDTKRAKKQAAKDLYDLVGMSAIHSWLMHQHQDCFTIKDLPDTSCLSVVLTLYHACGTIIDALHLKGYALI